MTPEVGHDGGLDVGEGAGFASLVGVADDGDPGQESGEDVSRPRARPGSDALGTTASPATSTNPSTASTTIPLRTN